MNVTFLSPAGPAERSSSWRHRLAKPLLPCTALALCVGLLLASGAVAANHPLQVTLFDEADGRCRWYAQAIGADGTELGRETIAVFEAPCRAAQVEIAPDLRQALFLLSSGADESAEYPRYVVSLEKRTPVAVPPTPICGRGRDSLHFSDRGALLSLCTVKASPAGPGRTSPPAFVHEGKPYVVDANSKDDFALAWAYSGVWKLIEVMPTETDGGCGEALGATVLRAYGKRSRIAERLAAPLRPASLEEARQLASVATITEEGEWRVARTQTGAVASWWVSGEIDGNHEVSWSARGPIVVEAGGRWVPLPGLEGKLWPRQVSLRGRFVMLEYGDDGPIVYDVTDARLVWSRKAAKAVAGNAMLWPPQLSER